MLDLPEKIGKTPVTGVAGRGNMGMVYIGYGPFHDRDDEGGVKIGDFGVARLALNSVQARFNKVFLKAPGTTA